MVVAAACWDLQRRGDGERRRPSSTRSLDLARPPPTATAPKKHRRRPPRAVSQSTRRHAQRGVHRGCTAHAPRRNRHTGHTGTRAHWQGPRTKAAPAPKRARGAMRTKAENILVGARLGRMRAPLVSTGAAQPAHTGNDDARRLQQRTNNSQPVKPRWYLAQPRGRPEVTSTSREPRHSRVLGRLGEGARAREHAPETIRCLGLIQQAGRQQWRRHGCSALMAHLAKGQR